MKRRPRDSAPAAARGAPAAEVRIDLVLLNTEEDAAMLARRLASAAVGVVLPVLVLDDDRRTQVLSATAAFAGVPTPVSEILQKLQTLIGAKSAIQVLERNAVQLDPRQGVARAGGRALDLTPREYELLRYFLMNPGRLVTRAEVSQAIWRSKSADPNVLDVHMSRLRRKVESATGRRAFKTFRGRGYQLV